MILRQARAADRFSTLVDLLQARAEAQGDDVVFRFLATGDVDGPIEVWTYADLDFRARALASVLHEARARGERALLLFPPGLDFIAAFMGCLYAGVVAVPTYPPDPARLDRTLPRLRAIAKDCEARFVLTTTPILGMADALLPQAPELAALRWIASDTPSTEHASTYRRPDLAEDTLAFLQYTSGSTGSPKGVMISHANVLHNELLIARGFGHDEGASGVGWLPLFHDMGLIGNVLQPLYLGFPCALMSPIAFLQRPERWLRAISHFQATTSGGPNFAYDLCVRKVDAATRAELDLGSWTVAFNGAEPIRRETFDRFADAFASCGFRRQAFYPCYGLAESTLLVTGGLKEEPPICRRVSGEALGRGRVASAEEGPDARWLVSSGRRSPDLDVVIVDPDTCTRRAPDEVGEIWISGPSVAHGYWGRVEETARAFGARLADTGEGPYLRTGDLGFWRDGELFVTGRLKDMIILRGQNHYPQDIEQTVERAQPCVRPGCAAAFAVEVSGEERLVVTAEAELYNAAASAEDVVEAIRRVVAEEHGAHAHAVVLLKPRTIPKTSSGKIQRSACRAGFLSDSLDVVLASVTMARLGDAEEADASILEALESAAAGERRAILERFLQREVAKVLRIDPARVQRDSSLMGLGLDSLMMVDVQARIEAALALPLPGALFWQHTTLSAAAPRLLERWESARRGAPTEEDMALPPPSSTAFDSDPPPSSNQLRLWFLDRLVPESASYNVHFGLRMKGALHEDALKQSLDRLIERHAVLRTVFREVGGSLRQVILPARPLDLPRADLRSISETERESRLQLLSIELARRPFDLAEGPLLRALLVVLRDDDYALLMTQHHIVTDGWSIGVLQRELASVYRSASRGSQTVPPPPSLQYADYARWQRSLGRLLDAQRAYWARRLANLPRLELPTDKPRPRELTHRGATFSFVLPPELAEAVEALARREGVTLFITLLAAYSILLHRYTGQDDFGVGTVVANRDRAEVRDLVGFFANTLVLRCDLGSSPTFVELLSRLRLVAAEAFANVDVPFDEIVEVSRAARRADHNPLFQVSFVLESLPLSEVDVMGMTWSPLLPTPGGSVEGTAKFDLELLVLETPAGLRAALEYSTDLFDESTIVRMAGHLEALLWSIVKDPGRPIPELSILPEKELGDILSLCAGPAPLAPESGCLHELFEAQAKRTPERCAVVFEGQELTYAELDTRADRLARALRARGVGPEVLVGLCAERSLEMLIGLLGILKAGGAYVPLDPDYPADRLAFMICDARISLLLTQSRLLDRLALDAHEKGREGGLEGVEAICLDADDAEAKSNIPAARPPSGVGPSNLAYVIYTSGSTGKPKGASIPHGAVVNLLAAMSDILAISPEDALLAVTSISFDIACLELFVPLLHGARVIIASRTTASDGSALIACLEQTRATLMQATPVTWQMMIDAGYRPSGAQRILCGGEALSPALARALAGHGAPVFNVYGPTETTIWSTAWRVDPERDSIRIGRPLCGTTTYVLDAALRPAPLNVPGELYIGGVGVARGYLGRAALTAERFLPDPFSFEPGARMYRTGDVARYRADTTLEFLGRADNQIKLRGHRVELGEIEAALDAHPGVLRSVVLLRKDTPSERRIVAYVVPWRDAQATQAALRRHLAQTLPTYMVPSAFVFIDDLPLTPNGKIDRKALPVPDASCSDIDGPVAAPSRVEEELITGIFCDLLGLTRVGVHDDFFALGGHSLMAIQATSRLRAVFGVEVPLRELFEAPTVAALAARVEAARRGCGAPPAPPLEAVPRDGAQPLSFAQERLWFLDQLEPQSAFYNLFGALRLRGPLDADVLGRVFAHLASRHEALRTTFVDQRGRAVQIIHPPPETWSLPLLDICHLPASEKDDRLLALAREEAARPFDLSTGPLLRTSLLRLGPEEHVLFFTIHHIVSDGWSLGVIVREVGALYTDLLEGREPALSALPVQYADYAAWQRRWLESGALADSMTYWRERLFGAPPLDLPTDRPRPPVQTYRGRQRALVVPKHITSALTRISREEGATLFMTLLAAFASLLHRYSRQQDLSIGTPVAGRGRAELEPLVGCFVNTLVLRLDLSNDPTVIELVRRVREVALGAYAHQDVPFERLVEALSVPRDPSRTPLFQVAFALQNAPMEPLALPGLSMDPLPLAPETAKFDLTLSLGEQAGELVGALEYNTDLFDAATIDRMASHLSTLLAGIAADPARRIGRYDIMTAEEQRSLVFASSGGAAYAHERGCIHRLFEAQVSRTPNAVALSCGDQKLTYAELNARANQLAHHLQSLGIGAGALVGLCVERSLDMVIGILGILKAGGAYVPLDPDYPRERLGLVLDSAGVRVIVAKAQTIDKLPAHDTELVCLDADATRIAARPRTNPRSAASPDHLAYVIYTSGSTGKPKGVRVCHEHVARLFEATQAWFDFGRADVWTLFHSYAFDFSVWEIWGALLYGGRLVVVPYLVSRSPADFHELLRRERVTVLNQTPSAFRQLIHADAEHPESADFSLRYVIFGGEALDIESLRPWFERHGDEAPQLINMYGITETTVHVTYRPITKKDLERPSASVIGRPIPDLQVYLLDAHSQPVPYGVPGEMYVGGAGVTDGYLHAPALTAERFVPDPFGVVPGARLYRSGDLARMRPDGDLEYLGRIDDQVKIRGFRIELGEIEAALGQHPLVRETVVVARREGAGDARLVAYVIPRQKDVLSAGALREHLSRKLPAYMVPAAFVLLDVFPTTPSGKIDRKALPAPSHDRPDLERAFAAPRTPEQARLAAIWAEVLGLERVGIDDNFFALGGDSIRSIRVLALAREQGIAFSLTQIFQRQTIRELAAALTQKAAPDAPTHAAPFALITEADRARLPDDVEDAYPISALQAGMIFHSELSPDEALYHDVFAFRLEMDFDPSTFAVASRALAQRHPVLRTSFDLVSFSEPLQLVRRGASIPVFIEDLRAQAEDEQQKTLDAWFEAERHHGFVWTEAPLLRFYVHRLGDRLIQFTVSFHHAILDGWSVATMLTELFQRVLGDGEPGQDLSSAFRDFVLLEREAIASAESARHWATLLDEHTPFMLPRLAPGARGQASGEARTVKVPIDRDTARALSSLARSVGVPLKSVLLAAHVWVMRMLGGKSDVLTGLVTNGRPETRDGERALGLYLNTLPLRLSVHQGSWLELIRDVFAAEQDLLPHRRYPLSRIQRDHGGPLFDAAFNYTHFHVYKGLEGVRGLRYLGGRFFAQTNFALMSNFSLDLGESDVHLQLIVSDPGIEDRQIADIAGHYERTLALMARAPGERPDAARVLSKDELERALALARGPALDFDRNACIHYLFEAQVGRTPDALAAVFEGESLTYRALARRVHQLAHYLRSLGVGQGARVGLCVERSLDTLIGILAILEAGGAYVPIDPRYPRERISFMLEDARVSAVITRSSRFQGSLPEGAELVCLDTKREQIARAPEQALPSCTTPEDLAYIIYTSGSTGRPKGVMIQHRSVINLASALAQAVYAGYDRPLRVAMNAPISFDASVKQWIQLLFGHAICIVPEDDRLDAERLLAFLRAREIDVLDCTPAQLRLLLDAGLCADGDAHPSLVLIGGEAIDRSLWGRLASLPQTAFFNVYGPTECTVDATARRVALPAEPALGRPLANMRVHVLDRDMAPVPAGVPGEIHIGGEGLARGYSNRPTLTAERFVPDPFGEPGARLYKTGDMGRVLFDGSIEYLGRIDHQVKVRGFRIELGEIEAALGEHPALSKAVVMVREDEPGQPRVVAYCVAKDPRSFAAHALRSFLLERLPEYMVPQAFVALEALPLTPNGKIDRRALPAPDGARPALDDDYVAPRTPVEEAIARIWAQVLGVEHVGVNDHFFALGGHSLLATQVVSRVRNAFDVEVPLRTLFEEPTVARLAQAVEGALGSDLSRGRAGASEYDDCEEGEL